jgi:hypothetical protein
MSDALADLPNGKDLLLDFYDRNRMATWVRDHPGIVSWVREAWKGDCWLEATQRQHRKAYEVVTRVAVQMSKEGIYPCRREVCARLPDGI